MNEWLKNPLLNNLDPIKKELILNAAKQTKGKSGKAMAPIMMSLIMNANKQGIKFTSEEMTLILDVLKDGKTDAEKQQIDNTIQMVMNMMKKKR